MTSQECSRGQVWDVDTFSSDDLIGETFISLEAESFLEELGAEGGKDMWRRLDVVGLGAVWGDAAIRA